MLYEHSLILLKSFKLHETAREVYKLASQSDIPVQKPSLVNKPKNSGTTDPFIIPTCNKTNQNQNKGSIQCKSWNFEHDGTSNIYCENGAISK